MGAACGLIKLALMCSCLVALDAGAGAAIRQRVSPTHRCILRLRGGGAAEGPAVESGSEQEDSSVPEWMREEDVIREACVPSCLPLFMHAMHYASPTLNTFCLAAFAVALVPYRSARLGSNRFASPSNQVKAPVFVEANLLVERVGSRRLMKDVRLEMPLDKNAEYEKARNAILEGNFTLFESLRQQVVVHAPRPPGSSCSCLC
jgi:hypothetical protein